MKKAMLMALAAMSVAAAPAAGQTIAQGMTPAQVQSEFGAPATTRDAGDWTYWYYHNGCPNRCGSDDVVFFQNDRVVAAVLRTQSPPLLRPPARTTRCRPRTTARAPSAWTTRPPAAPRGSAGCGWSRRSPRAAG